MGDGRSGSQFCGNLDRKSRANRQGLGPGAFAAAVDPKIRGEGRVSPRGTIAQVPLTNVMAPASFSLRQAKGSSSRLHG
jgi:hypothetical protein